MVGSHAIVIGKHLLLMVELRVRTKVVGKVSGLGLGVSIEGGDLARFTGIYKIGSGRHGD